MDRSGVILRLKGKEAIVFNDLCDYEKIKRTKDMFEGQLVEYNLPKKTGLHRYIAIASGIAAIMVITCLLYFGFLKYNELRVFAYVTLDVNPSIEYAINGRNCVVSIRPLNPESEKVINSLNMKGKDINIAISDTISELEKLKYIVPEKENVILLSASQIRTAKDQDGKKMQVDKIINSIQPAIKQMIKGKATVKVLYVSSETWKKSIEADMSLGRYALYMNAKKNGASITKQYAKEAPLKVLIGYYGGQTNMKNETNGLNENTTDKTMANQKYVPETDTASPPTVNTPVLEKASATDKNIRESEITTGRQAHQGNRVRHPAPPTHPGINDAMGTPSPEPTHQAEPHSAADKLQSGTESDKTEGKLPQGTKQPSVWNNGTNKLTTEPVKPPDPHKEAGIKLPEPMQQTDPNKGSGLRMPEPGPQHWPNRGTGIKLPWSAQQPDLNKGAGMQPWPDTKQPHGPINGEIVQQQVPLIQHQSEAGKGADMQPEPDTTQPHRPVNTDGNDGQQQAPTTQQPEQNKGTDKEQLDTTQPHGPVNTDGNDVQQQTPTTQQLEQNKGTDKQQPDATQPHGSVNTDGKDVQQQTPTTQQPEQNKGTDKQQADTTQPHGSVNTNGNDIQQQAPTTQQPNGHVNGAGVQQKMPMQQPEPDKGAGIQQPPDTPQPRGQYGWGDRPQPGINNGAGVQPPNAIQPPAVKH